MENDILGSEDSQQLVSFGDSGAPLSKRHAGVSVLGCAIAMVAVGGCAQAACGKGLFAPLTSECSFVMSCADVSLSAFGNTKPNIPWIPSTSQSKSEQAALCLVIQCITPVQ